MQLIFIYGPPAAGKLTIARKLAGITDAAVFHNHLVVDAVAAVFPFGSASFLRLREQFWLEIIGEAARTGQSLIFTFAPEPTVASNFPQRAQSIVESHGGKVVFIGLRVSQQEQESRLLSESRASFGKLRDLDLLRQLRPQLDACMLSMPHPDIDLNVDSLSPEESALQIAQLIQI